MYRCNGWDGHRVADTLIFVGTTCHDDTNSKQIHLHFGFATHDPSSIAFQLWLQTFLALYP